jgi:hypothetical protein
LTHDLLPPEKRKKPVVKRKLSVKEERHVKKEKRDVEESFEAEFIAAQANHMGRDIQLCRAKCIRSEATHRDKSF